MMNAMMSNSNGLPQQRPTGWQMGVMLTLAFWLSSSLFLDLVIMPGLYMAGMMTQPGFAGMGYTLFWLFNRLELLCAALLLTGIWVLRANQEPLRRRGVMGVLLAGMLMAIALFYTYGLVPQMTSLSLDLDLLEVVSSAPLGMNLMHAVYWVLEVLKLLAGGLLLSLCWRDRV